MPAKHALHKTPSQPVFNPGPCQMSQVNPEQPIQAEKSSFEHASSYSTFKRKQKGRAMCFLQARAHPWHGCAVGPAHGFVSSLHQRDDTFILILKYKDGPKDCLDDGRGNGVLIVSPGGCGLVWQHHHVRVALQAQPTEPPCCSSLGFLCLIVIDVEHLPWDRRCDNYRTVVTVQHLPVTVRNMPLILF